MLLNGLILFLFIYWDPSGLLYRESISFKWVWLLGVYVLQTAVGIDAFVIWAELSLSLLFALYVLNSLLIKTWIQLYNAQVQLGVSFFVSVGIVLTGGAQLFILLFNAFLYTSLLYIPCLCWFIYCMYINYNAYACTKQQQQPQQDEPVLPVYVKPKTSAGNRVRTKKNKTSIAVSESGRKIDITL
jgi:hypothetical protein